MKRLCLVLVLAAAAVTCATAEPPPSLRTIIPTPQDIEAGEGTFTLVDDGEAVASLVLPAEPPAKVRLAAEHLSRRIEEMAGVALPVVSQAHAPEGPALWLGEAGRRLVQPAWNEELTPAQAEQEYAIVPLPDGRGYALVGRQPLGTLYATMTVLGAVKAEDGRAWMPNFTCHDWPDIPYRWVGGFPSFDSVEDRIEWCMEHKINVINSPGFYRRTMDDAETQLAQNRFAREHGVRSLNLLFGNLGLLNRRGYPDGETYECLDEGAPSTRGWCVTNQEMLAQKQRILREFVEATEPGVLYIHFVDEDDIGDAAEIWLNRCDDCREAYPNDLVEAEDGKAGAQARVFDLMCEAIFSVSDPESGYDASRDCLIIFVSAPYTLWSEDDAAWDRELQYHCTVSRLMEHVDNVHFCIRENGLRRDNDRKRCLELAEALRERGNGHRVMMYFRGGDSRDTTIGWPRPMRVAWPMLAAPAMTASFEGAGSILQAGSAPGLLENEYSWNLRGDGFYYDPATQEEWRETYVGLVGGSLRPEEIFGDEGFLGRMLADIYGPTAASHLGVLYRPQPVEQAQGAVLPPASWSGWLVLARQPWFGTMSPDRLRQFRTLFEAWRGVNEEAISAVQAALEAPELGERHRQALERRLSGLQVGAALQDAAAHASEAWALVMEGDEEPAEAEMQAARDDCAQARELAAGLEEQAAEVEAQQEAMEGHYRALLRNSEQIREAWRRLEQTRATAAEDRAALQEELAQDSAADPARLQGKSVVLFGGGATSPMVELLEAHGAEVVPMPAAADLPEEALAADLIVLMVRSLSEGALAQLQDYIEGGGAVLLGSATPFYMVGNDVDLARIALWLGAERYGNYGGAVETAFDNAITRALEIDESMEPTRSAACLGRPLGAAPLLTAKGNRGIISALAHRFGDGRVGYLWTLSLGEDLQVPRAELLLRMAAWLVGEE
ncbi:MAG: hypothetical protein U9R79_02355 [Armatimonadota bacterium]|nr:hypothetical protein [Armatimonadota bacterium]